MREIKKWIKEEKREYPFARRRTPVHSQRERRRAVVAVPGRAARAHHALLVDIIVVVTGIALVVANGIVVVGVRGSSGI